MSLGFFTAQPVHLGLDQSGINHFNTFWFHDFVWFQSDLNLDIVEETFCKCPHHIPRAFGLERHMLPGGWSINPSLETMDTVRRVKVFSTQLWARSSKGVQPQTKPNCNWTWLEEWHVAVNVKSVSSSWTKQWSSLQSCSDFLLLKLLLLVCRSIRNFVKWTSCSEKWLNKSARMQNLSILQSAKDGVPIFFRDILWLLGCGLRQPSSYLECRVKWLEEEPLPNWPSRKESLAEENDRKSLVPGPARVLSWSSSRGKGCKAFGLEEHGFFLKMTAW